MTDKQNNGFIGRIKLGESRNPGGRPALSDDVREARRAKKDDFWRFFCAAAELNGHQLKELCENNEVQSWSVCAARMVKHFKEGHTTATKFIENQLFGKAVEPVALVSANMADMKDLDVFLNKCIAGEIVPTKEQLYALKLALQKRGDIPDSFGEWAFVTKDQVKEKDANV